ncbi:MAG: NAD-dependent epimerase/dehydratase family protein [Mucilaginibacter sp.]|nr:NAD-dependent epimerase/dehydratase family protein [Mucilaginibacter sp.]
MKILILGSEGFIGRHCVKYFQQIGYAVYGCDLVDYPTENYIYTKVSRLQPTFEEIFSNTLYDVCINAAGNGSVPVSIEHPLTDYEANCSDVIRILELIRLKNKTCKYLHISSAAVYGSPRQLPIKETEVLSPVSPYGWHKLMAETICREYHILYKIPVVIVRPFSLYGPGLYKQLFWDLFQKCKQSPNEIVLWGTGKESRDFIYINDLIDALDILIKFSPMEADIYNIANGIEITIEDAARRFIENFNSAVSLKFNNIQRAGDPINWKADITQITQFGYNLKYSFNDGIKETVTWLKGLK